MTPCAFVSTGRSGLIAEHGPMGGALLRHPLRIHRIRNMPVGPSEARAIEQHWAASDAATRF